MLKNHKNLFAERAAAKADQKVLPPFKAGDLLLRIPNNGENKVAWRMEGPFLVKEMIINKITNQLMARLEDPTKEVEFSTLIFFSLCFSF